MKVINRLLVFILSILISCQSANLYFLKNILAAPKTIEALTKIDNAVVELGFDIDNSIRQENYVVCYELNNKKVILPFGVLEHDMLTFRAPKTGLYNLIDNTKKFIDVKDNTGEIDFVTAREIFSGMEKDKFEPDYNVTRAMFVKVLANMDRIDLDSYRATKNSFIDVKQDSWYLPEINWAVSKNLISKPENNLFNPDSYITREDMACMLYRYSQSKNFLLWRPGVLLARAPFSDFETISEYAREAVTKLNWAGVLNAKSQNNFEPKSLLTRAEAAGIIKNFVTRMTQVN